MEQMIESLLAEIRVSPAKMDTHLNEMKEEFKTNKEELKKEMKNGEVEIKATVSGII
jgi:translation elongation factor EF-1beta